jgi:hypothetical protein
MRHLARIITVIMILFTAVSCSEDILKSEAADEDSLSLKTTGNCYPETAWVEGYRYVFIGNWATYTYCLKLKELPVCLAIYAGKKMFAGQVCFSAIDGDPNHLKLRIDLNYPCWRFQDVTETIKIQGYDIPPSGNPAPGLFTTYKGNGELIDGDYYITVPIFEYYGIHLDVQNCCVEEPVL